jgi:hypothetical protein
LRSDELHERLTRLDAELSILNSRGQLTSGQQQAWDRAVRARDKCQADLDQIEERNERVDELRTRMARGDITMHDGNPYGEYRRADVTVGQAAALRSLEQHVGEISAPAADRVDQLIRSSGPADNSHTARWIECHSRPEYQSAFMKLSAAGDPAIAAVILNDAERGALSDSYSLLHERAQSETVGAGGYRGERIVGDLARFGVETPRHTGRRDSLPSVCCHVHNTREQQKRIRRFLVHQDDARINENGHGKTPLGSEVPFPDVNFCTSSSSYPMLSTRAISAWNPGQSSLISSEGNEATRRVHGDRGLHDPRVRERTARAEGSPVRGAEEHRQQLDVKPVRRAVT